MPQAVLYIVIAILLIVAVLLIRFKDRFHRSRLHEHTTDHVTYESNDPDASRVTRVSKDGKKYTYCLTRDERWKRLSGYGIGGFFQGTAGFGIGELDIISMMLTKIPTRIAIGTSHAIVATTAISASILHFIFTTNLPAGYNTFPWNIPAMTVPAVILGGQFAPYVSSKLPTKLLEWFVSSLFVVIALSLVVLAITG